MKELKDIIGIPIKILKEVNERGKTAYYNNIGSVRLKDFSKNDDMRKGFSKRLSVIHWFIARLYAFIYKSIFQCMRCKPHDLDLYEQIKHMFA